MKQFKTILLTFLLSICIQYGFSQGYSFRVMASSGTSTANGKPLRVGSSIGSSAQIKVNPQSYLSLVHSSGGTVEIGKAGSYSASSIEQEVVKRSKQSTGGRLANYVIGELTKSGEEEINKNPYKYSKVTGSVERALVTEWAVMLPTINAPWFSFSKEYTVNWHPLIGASTYRVEVLDVYEETILDISTKDTFLLLDLQKPEVMESEVILIRVSTEDKNIAPVQFGITAMEDAQRESFEARLKEFMGTVDKEAPTTLDILNEAFFYEENMYLWDALRAYEALIEKEPDYEPFKVAYKQFLVRYKIGEYSKIENSEQ